MSARVQGDPVLKIVANLLITLMTKGVLTLAEAQDLLGVSDADLLQHAPEGMTSEQTMDYIAVAHRLTGSATDQ